MSFTLETLPEMRKRPSSESAEPRRMAMHVSSTRDIVRPQDRRCSSRGMPKTGFCDELAEVIVVREVEIGKRKNQ